MRKYLVIIFLSSILFSGCETSNIEIYSTKKWEGHFNKIEDAIKSLENQTLDKNETIWILSNRTLKRVLLETNNKGN